VSARPTEIAPCRLRRRCAGFIAAFVALAVSFPVLAPLRANAAPATYTGEAPVHSQSDDERVEALKTALANVVIQETGDSGVLARSDVAAAVAKAERYVLEYRYKPNPSDPDSPGPRWTLVAEFDSAAVDEMLQRLGLGPVSGNGTAPAEAAPSDATVWIGGIHSSRDYVRVMAYLARNNFVRSTQPVRARGEGMQVRLSLTTDLPHFLDVLGMERTLGVVSGAPPVDGIDATLALVP
jgi:hypothetical protein